MISKETYEAIMENKEQLDSAIIFDRDFHYNLCVSACRSSSWSTSVPLCPRALH